MALVPARPKNERLIGRLCGIAAMARKANRRPIKQ
jgi:hypothetical protein